MDFHAENIANLEHIVRGWWDTLGRGEPMSDEQKCFKMVEVFMWVVVNDEVLPGLLDNDDNPSDTKESIKEMREYLARQLGDHPPTPALFAEFWDQATTMVKTSIDEHTPTAALTAVHYLSKRFFAIVGGPPPATVMPPMALYMRRFGLTAPTPSADGVPSGSASGTNKFVVIVPDMANACGTVMDHLPEVLADNEDDARLLPDLWFQVRPRFMEAIPVKYYEGMYAGLENALGVQGFVNPFLAFRHMVTLIIQAPIANEKKVFLLNVVCAFVAQKNALSGMPPPSHGVVVANPQQGAKRVEVWIKVVTGKVHMALGIPMDTNIQVDEPAYDDTRFKVWVQNVELPVVMQGMGQ